MSCRIVTLILALSALVPTAMADLMVFAAASLSDAMKPLAAAYLEQGGEKIRFNFASSATLARQIAAGAPADLFISAHAKWMDLLESRNLIDSRTRFDLVGNRLVMIGPVTSEAAFDGHIEGWVAVGDFSGVPAGLYAEEALEHMGWLDALTPTLIMSSNVRAVLMYVERGEAAAGIVYASDAKASEKVKIIGTFPADAHSPIRYPAAACSSTQAEAHRFLEFLKTDQAGIILEKFGFSDPGAGS